jgi:type I restriction enzyme M protein
MGEYLAAHNPQARLTIFGQEFDAESCAICKSSVAGGQVTIGPGAFVHKEYRLAVC